MRFFASCPSANITGIPGNVSYALHRVPGSRERRTCCSHLFLADKDIVRIKRRKGKNAHTGRSQRVRNRDEHACHAEVEWTPDLQATPSPLHAETLGYEPFLADKRYLVRSPGDRPEFTGCGPPGNRISALQPAHGNVLGKQGEREFARQRRTLRYRRTVWRLARGGNSDG